MGLLRTLAIGAAVAYGINYATKKRPDGKSLVDDIKERAPEWMNKAKEYGDQMKSKMNQPSHSTTTTTTTNENF